MTAVLVGAVRLDVTGEVVALHDTLEAEAAAEALNVHVLTFFEDLLDLELLADLVSCGELGAAAELAQRATTGNVRLLELPRDGLFRVLLFEITGADDQSVVAVFLFGALADDNRVRLDDRARDDGAVFREDLSHAEFAPNHAGVLVHSLLTCC